MIAPGLAMFPHTAGVKGERAFMQNILRTRLPREPLKSQHSLLCPLQLTQTVCWTRQRAKHKPRPAWKPLEAEAAQRFDRKPESDAEYQDTSDASGVFWTWRTFPCWSGLKFDARRPPPSFSLNITGRSCHLHMCQAIRGSEKKECGPMVLLFKNEHGFAESH